MCLHYTLMKKEKEREMKGGREGGREGVTCLLIVVDITLGELSNANSTVIHVHTEEGGRGGELSPKRWRLN